MKNDQAKAYLWLWEYTDQATGERRRTTWRMTEDAARTRWGNDATKVGPALENPRSLGIIDFIHR